MELVNITSPKKRNNALNTLKILAALQVLFGHARVHLNVQVPDPLVKLFDLFMGVPIFFILSGFLIWKSTGKSKSFGDYAFKRFIRIYPELWLGVLVEILVLLVLFKEKINWVMLAAFTFTQSTILQFWTPDFLRSYGCGTPNGTLWTIGITIQFYLLAWLLNKVLAGKGIYRWGAALGISLVIKALNPIIKDILPELVSKLYSQTILPYLWMFVFGALLSEYQEKIIPHLRKWWWLLLAASVIIRFANFDIDSDSYGVLTYMFRVAGFIGLCYNIPVLNISFDISYGLFIYHMIVVNAMIELGFTGQWYHLVIVATMSVILASLSTIFGNYIAYKLKNKTVREKQ